MKPLHFGTLLRCRNCAEREATVVIQSYFPDLLALCSSCYGPLSLKSGQIIDVWSIVIRQTNSWELFKTRGEPYDQ